MEAQRIAETFAAYDTQIQQHPFVKDLYKRTRTNAKKYDDTVRIQQKISEQSGKINDLQREKLQKQATYKQSVDECLETLAIFTKHFVLVEAEPEEEQDETEEVKEVEQTEKEEEAENKETPEVEEKASEEVVDLKQSISEEVANFALLERIGALNISSMVQMTHDVDTKLDGIPADEVYALRGLYYAAFFAPPVLEGKAADKITLKQQVDQLTEKLAKLSEGADEPSHFGSQYTFSQLKETLTKIKTNDFLMNQLPTIPLMPGFSGNPAGFMGMPPPMGMFMPPNLGMMQPPVATGGHQQTIPQAPASIQQLQSQLAAFSAQLSVEPATVVETHKSEAVEPSTTTTEAAHVSQVTQEIADEEADAQEEQEEEVQENENQVDEETELVTEVEKLPEQEEQVQEQEQQQHEVAVEQTTPGGEQVTENQQIQNQDLIVEGEGQQQEAYQHRGGYRGGRGQYNNNQRGYQRGNYRGGRGRGNYYHDNQQYYQQNQQYQQEGDQQQQVQQVVGEEGFEGGQASYFRNNYRGGRGQNRGGYRGGQQRPQYGGEGFNENMFYRNNPRRQNNQREGVADDDFEEVVDSRQQYQHQYQHQSYNNNNYYQNNQNQGGEFQQTGYRGRGGRGYRGNNNWRGRGDYQGHQQRGGEFGGENQNQGDGFVQGQRGGRGGQRGGRGRGRGDYQGDTNALSFVDQNLKEIGIRGEVHDDGSAIVSNPGVHEQ